MKALILAAGFGVRLREIIHGRPKHLVNINGKPFLRYVVELLKKRGVAEVVISVGYLADYIIDEFERNDMGIPIKFSEDHWPLGTGGSLKKAQAYFKDDFLLVNGDTYLEIDYKKLMAVHKKAKVLLTIVGTTKKTKGSIITAGKDNKVKEFYSDKEVVKFTSKHFRHTGVYAVSPKIFDLIPKNTKISLEKEIIPGLLKKDKEVRLFPVNKEFIDVDSPEELIKAEKVLSK